MVTTAEKLPDSVPSPFGGLATLTQRLSKDIVAFMYKAKCGVDVTPFFANTPYIGLYECKKTGYKFWRPSSITGDEAFYHMVSRAWPNYYRTERWEYPFARRALNNKTRLLEIGSGRGYFLRSLESQQHSCQGLELNQQAIANKVTCYPVHPVSIETFSASNKAKFDIVCAFQVLEHIHDPFSFLSSAASCLAPNGKLIISTPNNEYLPHKQQNDAFDLPPHHMSHFNAETYARIASVIGMKKPRIRFEPREFTPPPVSDRTRSAFAYKLARLCAKALLQSAYRITGEPGATMLVVYEKSA